MKVEWHRIKDPERPGVGADCWLNFGGVVSDQLHMYVDSEGEWLLPDCERRLLTHWAFVELPDPPEEES